MAKPHREKNQHLENHKALIAKKHGYNTWNELRLNKDLKDAFIYLHEAAVSALHTQKLNLIKHYENKINTVKKPRKEAKSKSLQDELRRCFPVDRIG